MDAGSDPAEMKTFYFFLGRGIEGIEDELNWHGKPTGETGLAKLEAQIQNKGGLKSCIPSPVQDAPAVNITNVKLSSPPDYKLGDKVTFSSCSDKSY